MPQLRITCYHSFACTLDDTLVTNFYSAKAQALLVYVAVNQGQPHSRSALAGLLWPDYPEKRARRNLSQTLTALRKSVERPEQDIPLFDIATQSIAIHTDSTLWVDAQVFREKIHSVRAHSHSNRGDCPECLTNLRDATALYTGAFLENFVETDSDLFYDWVLATREQLQQEALYAFDQLSKVYAMQGSLDKAIDVTRQLLEMAPWQEEGQQQLMRLYASNGQRSHALSQYDSCTESMMDEFGIGPSDETMELYDQILAGTFKPDYVPNSSQRRYRPTAERLEGATVLGGISSESGLARPTQPSPSNVASYASTYYATLPPLENLVGRDEEIKEFSFRLQAQKCVPLVGMTGVGKSALARYLAEQWMDQNGGMERVFWHDFYPNEAEEIIEPLARFLAFHGHTAVLQHIEASEASIAQPRDMMGLLAREANQGPFLICLDNVHTVDDVPDYDYFLGKLLDGLPQGMLSLILVGQQSPRKLKERRFAQFRAEPLRGIGLDGVQKLLSQVGIRNGLVQQLHMVTDGNAEMLMLIRSWVDPNKLVDNLLHELYNVEAVNEFILDKIHEELTPSQHRIMAIIATFLGHPAPRDAVETVLDTGSILTDLRSLKERHLIRELVNDKGILTSTYGVHDIVRGFYYQTLGRSERITIHAQLGSHYRDHGNHLRALQQFEQAQELEMIADLIIDEAETLIYRGHLRRVKELLAGVVTALAKTSYSAMTDLYRTQGLVYRTDGEYAKAHQVYGKALLAIEDDSQKAEVLSAMGTNAYEQTDYQAALIHFEDSLQYFRSLGNRKGEATAIYGQGCTSYRLEELSSAQNQLETSKALAESMEDDLLIARCELTLGLIDWRNQELDQAKVRFTRALDVFDAHLEFKAKSYALINLGILEYELGNSEASLRYYTAAEELCETIGHIYSLRIALHNMGYHYLVNQSPAQAITYYQKLIEIDRDEPNPSLSSRAYSGLAQAHLAQGEVDQATDYANQAEELARFHSLEAELGIVLRVQGELILAMKKTTEKMLSEVMSVLEESIQLLGEHQEKDDLALAETRLNAVKEQLAQCHT